MWVWEEARESWGFGWKAKGELQVLCTSFTLSINWAFCFLLAHMVCQFLISCDGRQNMQPRPGW